MRVLLHERLVDGPQIIEHRIVLTHTPPPSEQVTAALVLAFSGDRFLMADLVRRGLDIPGGHVEHGESLEEAMRREVYEETGARLDEAQVLAWEHYRLLGQRPENYPYPYPDSYMLFYCARVLAIDSISANDETRGPVLLAPNEARRTTWVRRNPDLFGAALTTLGLGP
jgi:8-oxo-dGTP diphosphatase